MSKWLYDGVARMWHKADRIERQRIKARRGRLRPIHIPSLSRRDILAATLLILVIVAAIAATALLNLAA